MNMKAILTVMNTTQAIVKKRPENKFRPVRDLNSWTLIASSINIIYNKIRKHLTYYTKTIIIFLRFSEYCWRIPSSSSRGLYNNIHLVVDE